MDGYDVGGVKFTARDCDKIARYLRKKAAGKNPKLPKGMNEDCIRFYQDNHLEEMDTPFKRAAARACRLRDEAKPSLHEVSIIILTALASGLFAWFLGHFT